MKRKPIQIPPDIAEKCDEPDQFKKFDKEFSELAENTDRPIRPEPPAKRGRPKKDKG